MTRRPTYSAAALDAATRAVDAHVYSGDGATCPRIARAVLDAALSYLLPGLDMIRAMHTSDGAESPFCLECGHSYPCSTLRALPDRTDKEGLTR